MALKWTRRFESTLMDCVQAELVVREIAELERFVAERNINHKKAKKITGPTGDIAKRYGVTLMQWDINGEARLLYGFDEDLVLIDFSGGLVHDCLEKFKRLKPAQVGSIFEEIVPVSTWLKSELKRTIANKVSGFDALGKVYAGKDRLKFPEEKTREWLTFLDSQQRRVSDSVLGNLKNSKSFELHIVLGGAGTGKTMILRDVASKLNRETGLKAQLRVPPGVRNFLLSEGSEIPGLPPFEGSYQAILLDDPITLDDAIESIDDAKRLGVPIVIAIDPIQWHERRSIEKFEKILKNEKPFEYHLTVNYRQGKNVGLPAIETIKTFRNNTSEFTDRFREQINKSKSSKFESISLDQVTFAEDAGTYAFYSQSEYNFRNIIDEFVRVGRFKTERKWPKLLIGTSVKSKYPIGVLNLINEFEEVDTSFSYRQRAFSQFKDVRGTEYEAVIVFVQSSIWKKLVDGVLGAKASEWESLNAPLTFLTRAENRCVVFEIPDEIEFVGLTDLDLDEPKPLEAEAVVAFNQWLEDYTSIK